MNIAGLLKRWGLESELLIDIITIAITLVLVAALAWLMLFIAKRLLPKLAGRLNRRSKHRWDELLFDNAFFDRLELLLIPIVIKTGLSSLEGQWMEIINDCLGVWITVAAALLISAFLNGINRVYNQYEISRNHPLKPFLQVFTIFMWCAAIMICISIFSGKSVLVLLGGLTAFAAIIMLIFQDSILGFVAGIQLSANQMVRIGDWIVMPSRGVDGDVTEITLTTVKVQNWDKTITTIPTHKLVSESFTNWRGMVESGGRRIKRSINVDVNTIRYLNEADIEKLKGSAILKDYIDNKIAEIEEHNARCASHLDMRRLTNIGTFREYLEGWLANNPRINQDMTHMVRQLQPGPAGLPIEIYCFSANLNWIPYEDTQSDIFDHIYAVMPLFGLRAHQHIGHPYPEQ